MSRFGLMFTSLVIGSSKGIGKAIAYKLLACGHKVIGISRSRIEIDDNNYRHEIVDVRETSNFNSFLGEPIIEEVDNFIFCVGTNDIATLDEINEERIFNLYKMVYSSMCRVSKK